MSRTVQRICVSTYYLFYESKRQEMPDYLDPKEEFTLASHKLDTLRSSYWKADSCTDNGTVSTIHDLHDSNG